MVRAGGGSVFAENFEEKNCVAIGWDMGDLSRVSDEGSLRRLFEEKYPEGMHNNAFHQVKRFIFELKKGDSVVTYNSGTREYLIGEIVSDYRYDPQKIDEEFPNLREVQWLDRRVSRDDLSTATAYSLGSILTLFKLSDEVWEEIQLAIKGKLPKAKPEEADDAGNIPDPRELIKDLAIKLDPYQMQDLVAGILRAMGFKTRVSKKGGGDLGKDIIASSDGLGLTGPRIRVEVKHRRGQMSSDVVRSFIGALREHDRGLYVSTGGFSKEAKYEAERANVPTTLADLDDLIDLLFEHYENLDNETKALIRLQKIYSPIF
jgi:restriction system protein